MLTYVLSALSSQVVDTESIKGRRGGCGGKWSRLALRLAVKLDEKLDEKLDDLVKNNRKVVSSIALEMQDASSRMTRSLLRT